MGKHDGLRILVTACWKSCLDDLLSGPGGRNTMQHLCSWGLLSPKANLWCIYQSCVLVLIGVSDYWVLPLTRSCMRLNFNCSVSSGLPAIFFFSSSWDFKKRYSTSFISVQNPFYISSHLLLLPAAFLAHSWNCIRGGKKFSWKNK